MEATEQLILFTEAFLDGSVRISRPPASRRDSPANALDSGTKCSGWSARYSPVGYWLKTCVERSISPSIPFAPVWKMRDTSSGRSYYLLLHLERRTGENDSRSSQQGVMWPTPHRNCANGAGEHGDGGTNLQTAVMWPTPSVKGNHNRRGSSATSGDGLATAVKLEIAAKGVLNPAWVEILMGFPLGWTDVDCDEPEPWPGWPALMGESQYPYEPPRTVTGCPNRAKRLKCLGNAVVPAQARPFFEAMAQIHNLTTLNKK